MSYQNPTFLMEPETLAEQLSGDDVRVLDATVFLVPAERGYRVESGLERYRQAHIPGAAFMDLIHRFSDTTTGLGFSLPTPEALAAALGELGVGNEHRVVVYSSGHLMWATRAFWLLRYAGHDRTSVLNGGLQGWRDAGGETAGGDETYPPARFEPHPRPALFADLADTRAAMEDGATCTVNALSPDVYAGTSKMHYGRPGHIPGSRNLHYERLLDGDRFRPAGELEAALADTGLLDAPRVISYCGGGISATIDAFACLLAGQENVAVYDGSMSEWARDESLPLKTGEEP
ncbi:MAG: sulfurtransferase [Pseudomonadota bacterium]